MRGFRRKVHRKAKRSPDRPAVRRAEALFLAGVFAVFLLAGASVLQLSGQAFLAAACEGAAGVQGEGLVQALLPEETKLLWADEPAENAFLDLSPQIYEEVIHPVTVPDDDTTGEDNAEQEPPVVEPPADGRLPISPIVIKATLNDSYPNYGGVYVKNSTSYKLDMEQLYKKTLSLKKKKKDAVQVLIVHTHTTECYAEEGATTYDPSFNDRTTDLEKNVAAVGRALADELNALGIKTVQDLSINDYPEYNGAYTRSNEVIKEYMEEYPDIRVVIDLHRDSMVNSDGVKYQPVVTSPDGVQMAQLMFVVGTPQNGKTHKNWRENLAFAIRWQSELMEACPGIMRPISLRKDRFNQHHTTGSVIMEVGTTGNSLSEAKASAKLAADVLAKILA